MSDDPIPMDINMNDDSISDYESDENYIEKEEKYNITFESEKKYGIQKLLENSHTILIFVLNTALILSKLGKKN